MQKARCKRQDFCLASYFLLPASIFYFLAGCASKSVSPSIQPLSAQEVEQVMANIETQSFEFELKFSKIGVKGNFKGVKVNDKVKINGFWEFNSTIETLTAIGIEDNEYRLVNGKWEERTRTQDTQPISYLHMVCSIGEYKFKEVKYGFFIYEFKPNLLFMCPQLTSAYGEIWINIVSGLLEKVVAKSKLEESRQVGTIQWEFKFKNIGEHFEIIDPLAKIQVVKIIAKEEPEIVAQILKERFELYGFADVKYKLNGDCITLNFVSQPISLDLIQALLKPGKLEFYRVVYPTQSIYELGVRPFKEVYFVHGDSTKPVLLKEKLPNKLMDINLKYVPTGIGIIELTFNEELPQNMIIGIMVDSEIIEVVPEAWNKVVKINGDKETWVKIKYPLPKIASLKEGG